MKKRVVFCLMFSLVLSLSAKGSLDDIVYLHPKPNAKYADPGTSFILRFRKGVSSKPEFKVTGSETGPVSGVVKVSDQPNVFLYDPDAAFQPRETVSVILTVDGQKMSYRFTTCEPAPLDAILREEQHSRPVPGTGQRTLKAAGEPTILANGVSVPSDFPYIDVMVNENPSPGKIFLNNWNDVSPYNVMFNADGTPYWYVKTMARQRDFKVQSIGLLTARYIPGGGFIAYDSTYAVVDTFLTAPDVHGNTYEVDEHELILLENGHYLLFALGGRYVDMSQYYEGGSNRAGIAFTHLQEIDSEGNLVLHFDSQENLEITEFTQIEEHIRNGGRFPHMNAVAVDEDENLILSCRHMSAIYKIERETGNILWKLGGIHSDFTFINDPFDGFSGQHAVSVLGDHHYLLFDNGNNHVPRTSRAVEYVLDLDAMTATLVWEYRQEPDAPFSHYMGNAQRLPNGNTLINWAEGVRPKATEVTPDGQKVYEMNFERKFDCYRTYKFDWNVPAVRPYLLIESGGSGATLIFNQFGDPDVDYYKIYHGISPNPTTVLDTSRQTLKTFTDLENMQTHFFRVTSVSKTGEESDFSNEAATIVKMVEPGGDQILNGDFSASGQNWYFSYYGDGDVTANGQVEDGVYHLQLDAFTGTFAGAFFYQYPVELIRHESYLYEFDAWADAKLQIAPIVASGNGNSDYSRIGTIQVTTEPEHYAYEFTHDRTSTTEALAAFLIEERTGSLYVDNVSFTQIVTSSDGQDNYQPAEYRMEENYPNPFNAETTIHYAVPYTSEVSFYIYDLLGRNVHTLRKGEMQPGNHQIVIQESSLSSGVYFCRMEAVRENGDVFKKVVKMVLMK